MWWACRRQALCSACAKMCVRELRAESPNVSVFYMAWVSLVAALAGCFGAPLLGFTHTFRMPSHWAEWTLLAGIGAPASSPHPPLSQPPHSFHCKETHPM